MSKPIKLPSIEELKKLFLYDGQTGDLYRKAGGFGVRQGDKVGSKRPDGYVRVKVQGKLYLAHRIIWAMHNNSDPVNLEIDHIDGNRRNNKIENLRTAKHGQNQANSPAYKNNKTGFRGVHWHKQHEKYCATVNLNKKRIHVGLFACPKEAAMAYDMKAKEMFGEFAKTNFNYAG